MNIAKETIAPTGAEDRAYLVGVMTRVSGPVLEALSENKLKEKFPVERGMGVLPATPKRFACVRVVKLFVFDIASASQFILTSGDQS
jgi:hypothetical protein